MLIEPRVISIDVPVFGRNTTHKMAIYEWGNIHSPKGTVFCVHGLTRNGRDFDVLASDISMDYHVYSVDMAGRGRSEYHSDPAHYNYAEYVSDIEYIINSLSINNINWVGTSMGGIIGMMVANSFPKLLKTLILNDIGCLVPKEGLKRIISYVGINSNFTSRIDAENELQNRCSAYGIKNYEHWQNLFRHGIIENPDGSFSLAYDSGISKNLSNPDKEIEDANLWPLWEAIKPIPTLILRGNESDILRHDTAIEMQKTHPNCTLLEIDNVGHAPALMNDYEIVAIKKFLSQN